MHEINVENIENNQAAVILSFIYNAGWSNFITSSMATDIISGQMNKVTTDLLKWNKIRVDGKLTFSKGLFNRRMEESKCFINKEDCFE